jgi:hypothetical protein
MSTLIEAPGQAMPSIASREIIKLVPKSQNYEWGRTGTESEVRISDRSTLFSLIVIYPQVALRFL